MIDVDDLERDADGPSLAAARLRAGIRVGELAAAWGVTPSYVSRTERKLKLTPKAVTAYREALSRARLPF